jgi:hypothetical protein
VSRYDEQACLRRAENILSGGDDARIVREHQANALSAADPDEARIAKGFAIIARKRREHDMWRAKQYRRLANGEDIDE